MSARYEVQGRTAVITLDRPPINGLGAAMRRGLVVALARAEADPAVEAVVLVGAGRGFSGGNDLREFDAPGGEREPRLPGVVAAFEQAAKPVVAALHGVCAGGALELALACHYRVAAPDAMLALPDMRLGLVPGAGGSQRLPRAIGIEPALGMVLGGEPVRADTLAELPGQRLIDHLVRDGELLAGARAFAAGVALRRPLPRLRELPAQHPRAEAFLQFARHAVRRREAPADAALEAIDCIAAAVEGGFDAGLAREREAFLALVRSPEARARRHAFFAERSAARIPEVPEHVPLRPLYKVAVLGSGTRGSSIAIALLSAGVPVVLQGVRPDALERSVAAIRAHVEALEQRGRLRPGEGAQRLSLLRATLDEAELRDADLVVEAVPQERELACQVFRRLDALVKPGAILASASSLPLLDELAAATRRPRDVVGLHFPDPSPSARLLEVVRGAHTAPDVLGTVMRLAQRLRRTAVVCGVGPGFIAARLAGAAQRMAARLREGGCPPERIERAMAGFGFSAGLCRGAALLGEPPQTGAAAGPREPSGVPQAADALEMPASKIAEALVLAMIDEAARLLEEGVALRPGDVDLVSLSGLGFPLWRGGLLWHADQLGPQEAVWRLRQLQRQLPGGAGWEPAPLLARLAADGATFH